MKNKKGNLILLFGPSGSGKGTIRKEIFKHQKDLNIIFSVSTTTRQKRKEEVEGKDYFFIEKEDFENKISNNYFIEWAKYVNNYYGTSLEFIEKNLSLGKNIFLEIELEGVKQVLNKFPDSIKICLFPPNLEELKKRLLKRKTENYVIINDRIEKSKKEIEEILKSDSLNNNIFINNELKETFDKILFFIIEKLKNEN